MKKIVLAGMVAALAWIGAVEADDNILILKPTNEFTPLKWSDLRPYENEFRGRKVIVKEFYIYKHGLKEFLRGEYSFMPIYHKVADVGHIACHLRGNQADDFAKKPGKHTVKLEGKVYKVATHQKQEKPIFRYTLHILPCQYTMLEEGEKETPIEITTQTRCQQARAACGGIIETCKRNTQHAQRQQAMCRNTARNYNPGFRTDSSILRGCVNSRNAAVRACEVAKNCLRQRGCSQ